MATTMTKTQLDNMTPQQALEILLDGNKRYLSQQMETRNYLEQTKQTSGGQHPYAVVLGCIDSRVPLETVLDVGVGDIFGIRIAGNFVNDDILGSMEFACGVVGSKLILVLGHTSCGAVKGAYDNVEMGHLTGLVNKIKPAVEAIKADDEIADNDLDAISHKNVELTVEAIKARSSILADLASEGTIDIVGGMYDVGSGKVTLI